MIKVRFLRSCRVCERGTLATFGKEWVHPKTGTLPGRCHVQGRAGEARNHATWISKSRYARFRASSVRDFDEDALLETLTERTTPTTTSRQRGIYASIIASVSLCFAKISIGRLQAVQVKCKPVGNGSIARPQPTLTCTSAHAGHRARQASPFSRPGRVRLSGAGPKVFRKGQ